MPKISDIKAREILDSRGNPTVSAAVFLDNGMAASASVPSGASKGKHEAVELRDGDGRRFRGLGVLTAVANVTDKIKPAICGFDPSQQQKIDQTMLDLDGTDDKANLGANSILAVYLSCCKAAAKASNMPLYTYIQKMANSTAATKLVTPLIMLNSGVTGFVAAVLLHLYSKNG